MTTIKSSIAVVVALLAAGVGCSRKAESQELAASSASTVETPAPAAPAGPESAPAPEPPGEAAGGQAPKAESNGTIPAGYVKMSVGGVAPTSAGDAVLLVDALDNVAIPIFIGGTEALSIQLRLEKRDFVRPLTHDLYDETLKKLGGKLESVRVDRLQNNTYFGTIVLKTSSRRVEIDARPSDAIALALGNQAPIHVAKKVVAEAGIKLDEFQHGKPPIPDQSAAGDKRPDPISL
jgi:uncharacterized protein